MVDQGFLCVYELFLICCFYVINSAAGTCSKSQYQCFDGECIPLDAFCDEKPDCKDRSDENECYNECLLRGDLFGMKYTGERRITAQGLFCDEPCRWGNGTTPQCVSTDGQIQYCQIPICENLQERSMEFPLFHNKIRWTLVDLESHQEIQSTDCPDDRELSSSSAGQFCVNDSSTTQLVLKSPIVEKHVDFMCVRMEYSLKKSRNVDVKLIEWGPYYGIPDVPTTLDETNAECDHCVHRIDIYADEMFQYQAKIYIFLFPQGGFNFAFEIKKIVVEELECGGTLEEDIPCPEEMFKCYDYRCVHTDVIHDQYKDCENNLDDQGIWAERERCSPSSIQCYGSNSCLPATVPLELIVQCISNQTRLPVQTTLTMCPSYHTCKHKEISSASSRTCLSESEICDGIPQCPHWDDEVDCPLFCPPQCTKCDSRRFHCPPSALQNISTRVSYLDLSGYNLDLATFCSIQRVRLVFLNVSSCQLTNVSCLSDTDVFPRLQVLDVSNNNLLVVYRSKSQFNYHLAVLILDQNPILLIMVDVNYGILSLRNCSIHRIIQKRPQGDDSSLLLAFNSIPPWYSKLSQEGYASCSVTQIDLSFNVVDDIDPLNECSRIKVLNLHHNLIRNISNSSFSDHYNALINLTLSANVIEILYAGFFERFKSLQLLNLSMNIIHEIKEYSFRTMNNLLILDISKNKLDSIPIGLFDDLISLVELNLQGNRIVTLDESLFRTTTMLDVLNLSYNRVYRIPNKLFWNLRKLRILDLRGNGIIVASAIFGGLGVLQRLKVARFSLCCVRPSSVHLYNCEAEDDFFSSCYHLLGSKFLSVIIWIMSCFSICGNFYLLWFKHLTVSSSQKCIHCLITNMVFSDILMGLYLLIIALVDVVNRESYGLIHDSWKNSNVCTSTGILATTSVLGINLFLLTHSVIRMFSFDFKYMHERCLSIVSTMSVVIVAATSAVLPIVSINGQFYTLSNICFPLPIIENIIRSPSLEYSFGLYIIFSLVTFIFVLLCEVISVQRKTKEKEGTFVYLDPYSMTFISYVLCHGARCIPLSFFGCMALTGRYASYDTYVFVAIFITPMSSTVNPLIQCLLMTYKSKNFENRNICLKTVHPEIVYPNSTKSELQDVFLVTEPKLSRKNTVSVIFRGESGWMQKVSEVQIINKVIKCTLPKYRSCNDNEKEKVSVQIQQEEQAVRSNKCFIEYSS